MITVEQIKYAMQMLDNPRLWLNCDAIHKQIARSLEVYQDRAEYDGSFESAVDCLRLAEYEVIDPMGGQI